MERLYIGMDRSAGEGEGYYVYHHVDEMFMSLPGELCASGNNY